MKQYLLSILYLLAALVQPAIAQNSPQTKAAPDAPVMPYVVTIVQPTIGDTANLLTVTTDYPTKITIKNGDIAYNGKEVNLSIKRPPHGYDLADDFPKVYKTNDPNKTLFSEVSTFTMPKAPVTIEVKYIEVKDLDLSKLSDNNVTLATKDGKWMYRQGKSDTYTQFTGTVTGKGTCTLTINTPSNPTLILANGTELTGNIELSSNTIGLSLQVEEGGTATVRGNITVSNFSASLDCNGNGRLNIYGEVTGGSTISNLMQWTWTTAPKAGQTISLSTPLELPLTTFIADGSRTIFTSYLPENTPVKVKVGDAVQKDGTGTTTFKMDPSGTKTIISDLEDSDLPPAKDDNITITSKETYNDASGSNQSFSGTVTGEVSTIKVDVAVTGNPVIILEGVKKKGDTNNSVEVAAEVTLALKGTSNEVSTIKVVSGGTLTLTTVAGGGSFATPPTINNAGTFISETSLIKTVGGDAPLNVTGEPAGSEITADKSHTMTVVASSTDQGITPTYQWQSYDKNTKKWTDITATSSASQLRAGSASGPTSSSYATNEVGTYRCAITSKKNSTTTTLYTKAAEVTLKSDPDPAPTKHSVTLPAVTGATTDPIAGVYQVDSWSNFAFSLTLSKDYDQSKPVVKNSRGETITPRTTDGKYVVTSVREDITIQITGIMSNIPTGIAGTETGDRVWGAAGQLCIHTDSPKSVYVYNVRGQLQKVVDALNGDINVPLPAGNYIVVVGNKSYKVQVSR